MARPAEIIPNAMFVGTFSGVEAKPYNGTPRYSADGTVKQQTSIVWHWTLRDHGSLETIYGSDGLTPYEMWRFTSDATSQGSVARDILHALAGREVSNAEVQQLLAADPSHLPIKLLGRSVLLIMGSYNDKNGVKQTGINQILALSPSDKARLTAKLQQEQHTVAPGIEPLTTMGAPAQRFDQNGNEVTPQPQPQPVGAQADGSADLPW